MRCTMQINHRTVQCFVDTGATGNFTSKSLAKELDLQVQPDGRMVRLGGGKQLRSYGDVHCVLGAGGFEAECKCTLLDIRSEIILGRPFWEQHKVQPDYESGGMWHIRTIERFTRDKGS
jgi:hypothetical protein